MKIQLILILCVMLALALISCATYATDPRWHDPRAILNAIDSAERERDQSPFKD